MMTSFIGGRDSVADVSALVADLAVDVRELPAVAPAVEHEDHDALLVVLLELRVAHAVGVRKLVESRASGADHELPNASRLVRRAIGALLREALVGVVVAGQDHI